MGDVLWRGEVMSREWAVVNQAMSKDVDFGINEARRTMARQWYFWNGWSRRLPGFNLAAYPSPWAPHIRVGRVDHAIDFANPEGVMAWLTKHGLHPTRPAGSGSSWEPWHIEVPADRLKVFAKSHSGHPWDHLPLHVRRAVKQFVGARNTVRDRIRDRDRIDSKSDRQKWLKRDELVKLAVKKREKRKRKVARMLKRARKESTKRVLRKVLNP